MAVETVTGVSKLATASQTSLAPSDSNYTATISGGADDDHLDPSSQKANGERVTLSKAQRLTSTKSADADAIEAAQQRRSQLSKKELQKLDDHLQKLIWGKVPRMVFPNGPVFKFDKTVGFSVGTAAEIEEALAAGADIHLGAKSKSNQDALWYEIANKKRPEVADIFLRYGATLDASKIIGASYYNSSAQLLQVLLDYGGNPNQWEHLGISPLLTAAQYGNPAGARLLMQYGADPSAKCPRSQKGTPLATACHKLNVATVQALLEFGADINAPGYDHLNPAQAAIDTVVRMSTANANNGKDRLFPILAELKAHGATEPEIDAYLDPYSEATKSLIHPWDYNAYLKKIDNQHGPAVAARQGTSSSYVNNLNQQRRGLSFPSQAARNGKSQPMDADSIRKPLVAESDAASSNFPDDRTSINTASRVQSIA